MATIVLGKEARILETFNLFSERAVCARVYALWWSQGDLCLPSIAVGAIPCSSRWQRCLTELTCLSVAQTRVAHLKPTELSPQSWRNCLYVSAPRKIGGGRRAGLDAWASDCVVGKVYNVL